MVSHWSLSNNKSPQISRTLLSIPADFNNAVLWMVSILPLLFKSFSPCINPLVTVPSAPIIIDITVTLTFHSFFQFPRKIEVLIFLLVFFQFYTVVSRISKVHKSASSLFCCWLLQDLIVWPRLGDLFVSQNPWGVCAPHSQGQILECAYTICPTISCITPNRSPCPPSCVWSYTLSVLIRSFPLDHQITYISSFVTSYLFLLLYEWS